MHSAWFVMAETRILGSFLDGPSLGRLGQCGKLFKCFAKQVLYVTKFRMGLQIPDECVSNIKMIDMEEVDVCDDILEELAKLISRASSLEEVFLDVWGYFKLDKVEKIADAIKDKIAIKTFEISVDVYPVDTSAKLVALLQKLKMATFIRVFVSQTRTDILSVLENLEDRRNIKW